MAKIICGFEGVCVIIKLIKIEPMNDSSLSLGKLPKPQKVAVFVLSVLAVFIIVFWVWQMQAQINRPFADRTTDNTPLIATSTDINAILKARDTDSDGLSDYDEIYTYKTSPYLEDTDSDGILDRSEVEQGTDPNCPQGQNCSVPAPAATVDQNTPTLNQVSTGTESGIDNATLQNAVNGQIDATTLRKLLLSGGASKDELDKISDADLMKSYQDTLNKQSQTQ